MESHSETQLFLHYVIVRNLKCKPRKKTFETYFCNKQKHYVKNHLVLSTCKNNQTMLVTVKSHFFGGGGGDFMPVTY